MALLEQVFILGFYLGKIGFWTIFATPLTREMAA